MALFTFLGNLKRYVSYMCCIASWEMLIITCEYEIMWNKSVVIYLSYYPRVFFQRDEGKDEKLKNSRSHVKISKRNLSSAKQVLSSI
jgi:hypothetical protein